MSGSPANTATTASGRADEALLTTLLNYWGTYHHHKETVAFSIFGLEGAFFIGLFSFANWPDSVTRLNKTILIIMFLVVWALFHAALRFQLRARRVAAIHAAALADALLQRVELTFTKSLYPGYGAPSKEAQERLNRFDEWLFPVRRATRPADVDIPRLADGSVVQPCTLDAFKLHLARHRNLALATREAYAMPMEYLSTVGSILMLFIALVRVITLEPAVPLLGATTSVTAPASGASAQSK